MAACVGERLKAMRLKRGYSLRGLATLASVPVSTISAVESGERQGDNLTLATGRALAQALGVTLDYLAMVNDTPTPPSQP